MIKTFTCRVCGVTFEKETRSYAFYCPDCRKKKNVEKVMESRKRKSPQVQVGVGSGGNQKGENNPCWKGGHSIYKKTYYESSKNRKCSLCGSTHFLVVHHKDGNRENGKVSNLLLVCRSCHAKIHNLYQNLGLPKKNPLKTGNLVRKSRASSSRKCND